MKGINGDSNSADIRAYLLQKGLRDAEVLGEFRRGLVMLKAEAVQAETVRGEVATRPRRQR